MRARTLPALVLVVLLPAALHAAWSIKHPVYTPDLSNISAADVAAYMTMSESQLRALITTAGPVANTSNVTAKQAAYDLARMYQKTKTIGYADRAVILLERFAEVMPSWPVYTNDGALVAVPVSDTKVWTRWNARGLWGVWHHQDLQEARELPLAYDFVAGSGAVAARSQKRGKDVAKLIEDDLLRYSVEVSLHFEQNGIQVGGLPAEDHAYGNMAGYLYDGTITFGKVVEPAFIHITLRRMRNQLWVSFFRDGAWRESTPSYHRQVVGYCKKNEQALAGYSDPTGFTFTGYTTRLGDSFAGAGQRIDSLVPFAGLEEAWGRAKTAMDLLTYPNSIYHVVHDTHSTQQNWEFAPTTSAPGCLFGMRHCVMGRFADAEQVQVDLHFGGTDGHEHYDSLNLALWALGAELLSEGEYKEYGNEAWNRATAGHNTIVVDETNQNSRWDNGIAPTVDDALDGIGFYHFQDYGQGDSRNSGDLQLWDVTLPHLMVVEAAGESAYKDKLDAPVTRYRRALVMVQIEGTAFYLIDVFRVAGGTTHDWMLHGRLDEDYTVESDLTLASASGKRFDYLALSKQAVTDGPWYNEFVYASGARLRTTMLGATGTEVSTGRAPAMRRAGEATFVDVRRTGGESVFVAVHEPHDGTPRVVEVKALLAAAKADDPVALTVTLDTGRVDTFALTLDQPPYPERTLPGTDVSFKGRLVYLAKETQGYRSMVLLEGASLTVGDMALEAASGDFSHRGTVTDVLREAKGDADDAFVTTTPLPTTGLEGHTLLLQLPDGRTEGYTIEQIVTAGGSTQIRVKGDPGLELRDGGKLVKLVYFPHHGLRGALTFLIPGGVYRDKGVLTATAPVGPPGSGDGPVADGGATDADAATTAGDGPSAARGNEGCGCEVACRPAASGCALLLVPPLLLMLTLVTRRCRTRRARSA